MTLRLHAIKKLQSPLNTPWRYILLMYFTFLVKALPPCFYCSLGIFIFAIYFAKSKLIAISVPVLTLQEKMYYSLFWIYMCYWEIKSICRKYRHKSIYITNKLTTIYCYSAASSITNLSNNSYSSHSFKVGITLQVILFPLQYHPLICKRSLIPKLSLMSREYFWSQSCISKFIF